MIIKTDAIEPKATLANSTYLAIILYVSGMDNDNVDRVGIQFYCPDTMNGSILDAKVTVSNYNSIEAPKYLFRGINSSTGEEISLKYDFKVGGVIQIAYQDGNLGSPQFVDIVNVDEDVIVQNKIAVDTGKITSIVFDKEIGSTVEGTALTKVLEAFNNGNTFHTYAKDGKNYLTILKLGKYGTELIFKSDKAITSRTNASFDYFYEDINKYTRKYKPSVLANKLLESSVSGYNEVTDTSLYNEFIKVVNNTIKQVETESKFIKDVFSSANISDVVFWLMQLIGVTFTPDNLGTKYVQGNLSEKILTNEKDYPVTNIGSSYVNSVLYSLLYGVTYADIVNDEDLEYILGLSTGPASTNKSGTIYHANLITETKKSFDYSNEHKYYESLTKNIDKFSSTLWKNIANSDILGTRLKSYYNELITSIYYIMITNLNPKSNTSMIFIMCALIAVFLPALEPVMLNLSLYTSSNPDHTFSSESQEFIKNLLSAIESNEGKTLPYNGIYTASTTDLTARFTKLYFEYLGFPINDNDFKASNGYVEEQGIVYYGTFRFSDRPAIEIRNMIKNGFQYIFDNYDSIVETLSSGKLSSLSDN